MDKQQPEIEITAVRTADLAINPRNARKHSQKQIAQIAASILEFGFTNPLLINEKRRVIAGHGRLLAAKELGLEFIPAIKLAHLSEAQERALAIADNKIALNSSWDLEILSEELEFMSAPDFEIDVGIIGFDTPEIDLIIGEPVETSKLDPADKPIGVDRSKPAITQSGDLWICGKHRLYCGSALDAAAYDRLMAGEQAQMVITDPPYNVKIDGHVSGLGKARHQEFAMASGEMTGSEFKSFLQKAFGCMAANSIDGALPSSSWTGATCRKSWPQDLRHSRSSRTFASGTRPTEVWDPSTARSTNWCSSSRPTPLRTSTMSNSDAMAGTAPMSGTMRAPIALPPLAS